MKIVQNKTSKILRDEERDFNNYLSFLNKEKEILKKDNLTLDLLEIDIDLKSLLLLLPLSNDHKENNKSFVVVTTKVNVEEVPEELSVVPTLREAEDLIQMEEIERDLGF